MRLSHFRSRSRTPRRQTSAVGLSNSDRDNTVGSHRQWKVRLSPGGGRVSMARRRAMRISMTTCERGALSVPLLLSLVAISLMGFGTWGVMRRWRHLTETQLRLDRCVGDVALELKGTLNRIERANGRMRKARALNIPLSLLNPPAAEALKKLLMLQSALQDLEQFRWQARRARWLVQKGCGDAGKLMAPLPAMDWKRPPDDPLGPMPLQWIGANRRLQILLFESSRSAVAAIEAESINMTGELIGEYSWKAAWTRPGMASSTLARLLRPITH